MFRSVLDTISLFRKKMKYDFLAFALLSLICCCYGDNEIARRLAEFITLAAEKEGIYHRTADHPLRGVEPLESKVDIPVIGGDKPKVNTTSGLAEGTTTSDAHAFFEIPYAEPPVGNLRFQPPLPLQTRRDIDASTRKGLMCHQTRDIACIINPLCDEVMNEDCLVLNIFVPSYVNLTDAQQPPEDRLPVLFYIHGGSFSHGAGTTASKDGKELASVTNTIVVVINYRLGPFGFLVHKETGKPDIEGNQGLADQRLALQWIQDNIAMFGGDKNKVTIFGGSAGAQSVMFHTLSTKSRDLYDKAIQQSNPAVFSYQTPDESLGITTDLVEGMCRRENLSERECLMTANATELTRRQLVVQLRGFVTGDVMAFIEPYRPVIDGVEFTDQPLALYRDGKWNSDKNMIVGVNTEELDQLSYILPEQFPTGKTMFTIVNYYLVGPGKTDLVVKKYEEAYTQENDDYAITFAKELSHMYFACPSRALARYASLTTTGNAQVFFYADEHGVVDSLCEARNNGSSEECYFASHGSETRFVFRTVQNPTAADQTVEDQFSTYWGSFARTENPSNDLETSLGDYPNWPEYTPMYPPEEFVRHNDFQRFGLQQQMMPFIVDAASNGKQTTELWQNIRIKAPVGYVETGYEEDICEFWDSVGYYMDPIPLPTTTTPPKTVGDTQPSTPIIRTTSDARFDSVSTSLIFMQSIFMVLFL